MVGVLCGGKWPSGFRALELVILEARSSSPTLTLVGVVHGSPDFKSLAKLVK